jgi:hypothetical protein
VLRRACGAALVAGALLAPVAGATGSSAGAAPVTTVAVGACELGTVVPTDFLGLSIEWSMVEHWFGTSTETAVPATVELLKTLRSSSLTSGVLRIGGSSQDGYRWDPEGTTARNSLFFGSITSGMVDALLEVARQSGWKVVLGLNLRTDKPEEAAALVRYAVTQDPTRVIMAAAPGNEPDAYLPDLEQYLERYGRYAEALAADPLTRTVLLTGPDSAHGKDLARIAALQKAHGSRLAYLGWHHYGNRPSLEKLLDPAVSERFRDRVLAAADGTGLTPVRMSEGNSVGHGGLRKVSDVTGSTAWTVDTVLTGAAAGLAGYHVHSWDNHYYQDPRWRARYTPLFVRGGKAYGTPGLYAMALLRDVSGRRFCDTTVGAPPTGTGVKAWALAGLADRSSVVYLVNKGLDDTERVRVALPAAHTGAVRASRIVDPEGCAGRAASLNGGVLQPDGSLTWTPEVLTRAVDGTVTVDLQPCQVLQLSVVRDDSDPALPPPL